LWKSIGGKKRAQEVNRRIAPYVDVMLGNEEDFSAASGLIYGFLAGKDPQWAVECGAAHGALAMTTLGDTTMTTLDEVLQVMKGVGARISR
jgi:sugar/nucleoside kinase (ribokinase family)